MKIIHIILFFFFISIKASASTNTVAERGIMDLSDWNFVQNGSVYLNGEWEFYWSELLNPNDFNELTSKKVDYINVPNYWNGKKINGKAISGKGYATYRLRIKVPEINEVYALKILTVFTSYRLYVNGQLLSSAGKPGKTANLTTPASKPNVILFTCNRSEIEIVLQVANFHHRSGGAWQKLELGSPKSVLTGHYRNLAIDMFVMGSILIMAFYHLGLFILRRKEKQFLSFGLFCLVVNIRILVTSEITINYLADINWQTITFLEYLTFYLAIPLFVRFIYHIFYNEFSLKVLRVSDIVSSLFILTILFLPASIYSYTVFYYELFTIILGAYTLYVIGVCFFKKREGTGAFLMGFVFLFATYINDLMYQSDLIHNQNMVQIGLCFFIFVQAFVISTRFAKSFSTTEKLTDELNAMNQNLENIVKERTVELEAQKINLNTQAESLRKAKQMITLKSEILELQKEEIESQTLKLEQTNEELKLLNLNLKYQTKALDTSAIVAITDANGNITYVNRKFEELSQYTANELIGENHRLVKSSYHPQQFYEDLWKTITIEKNHWRGEICNKAKDGQIYWVDASIVPFLDEKDNVYQFLSISFDITNRKLGELQIKQKNREITQSITYAKYIQDAILAQSEILHEIFSEYYILFEPQAIVSGDFYYVRKLDNHRFVVAVADCTGHGVPGGFMSVLGTALLNEIVRRNEHKHANQILNELRYQIKTILGQTGKLDEQKDGMDISLCVINTDTKTLEYSGAYHDLLYAVNVSKIHKREEAYEVMENEHTIMQVIDGDKMPVGIHYFEKESFTYYEMKYEEGDTVFLFSDGYRDQIGGNLLKRFTKRKFYNLLLSIAHLPLTEQKDILQTTLQSWKGNARQIDDISVMGVRF